MVIIKFLVKGQRLILETDLKGLQPTSDSYNYYKCLFEFDSNWDGFEKRVYFKNASFNITKPMLPDDLGYCYIPSEVLAHTGVIVCTVTGVKYSGTSVAERLTAGPVKFFVRNPKESKPFDIFIQKEEGTLEPDNPDITPTEYEQFVGKIKSYADDAAASKSAAEAAIEEIEGILESAFEAVENKIDSMTVSASAGEAYSAPEVIRTDYEDHFNLEFVIPKGDPGEDGLDGQDGFSPIANVSKDGDTATITITDSLGTTTAEVSDGQDGNDGADGHSPVITANKVGKVTTVYADGVAIATINDGQDGGGSGVFIAEIGTTSYSDIDTAFQGGKLVIGRVSGTGDTYFPLVVDNSSYYNYYSFQVTSGKFVFEYKIDNTDEWTTSQYVIATDDEATTSKKGLMSSSDKTKLNGIASGAEVNVQSDWNEADSSDDAYIKNKPTIPTSLSALSDDATHRLVTDTEKSTWNGKSDFSGDYDDLTNKPTIPTKISDLLNDLYEKGTTTAGSVTWTYRKWADKELEMWGEASTTLAINTASGSLYTTASTYEVAMPSFVASCDFFTGELSGGGWVDITDMTNPPKVRFYAPTSYGSATRYLRYYMKGTWA